MKNNFMLTTQATLKQLISSNIFISLASWSLLPGVSEEVSIFVFNPGFFNWCYCNAIWYQI